jgi:phosphatidylserine/phosphatidylglycerophosphate/cardiolipin synthase-like enzyme
VTCSVEFITDRRIYERVIQESIPAAETFVWIATADIKDMYVHHRGRKMAPFLAVLSDLVDRGVSARLIHAKEPGPAFREDYDRYPNLIEGMEMILCPRVHFKSVVVDGTFAFSGSANLTGAGMGAKGENRRNFEAGFTTRDRKLIGQIMEQFDSIWMGERCASCERKAHCVTYLELLQGVSRS